MGGVGEGITANKYKYVPKEKIAELRGKKVFPGGGQAIDFGEMWVAGLPYVYVLNDHGGESDGHFRSTDKVDNLDLFNTFTDGDAAVVRVRGQEVDVFSSIGRF
jgi:hypothetical protein